MHTKGVGINKTKDFAIKLTGVFKKYIVHHEKPTLAERLFNGKNEEFYALKNVSLTVNNGERLGIIGANGSGKTTLLKIIAGITTPSKGSVLTQGKVVSLIDLEAGFHPDLTGLQNIYLSGMLLGLNRNEIDKKLQTITDFAGLHKFIDTQLYTYSEGMKLRLGFSVAVSSDPDILLMDENFIVADEEYRSKALKKIQSFVIQGKTIIIASHYLQFLNQNCDRLIYIKKGKIQGDGRPDKIIKAYTKDIGGKI
jgi:ABC-type polysaccharide/polyol phosphate transport system ATPase subunit